MPYLKSDSPLEISDKAIMFYDYRCLFPVRSSNARLFPYMPAKVYIFCEHVVGDWAGAIKFQYQKSNPFLKSSPDAHLIS